MKKILKSILRVNLTAIGMIIAMIITVGDLLLVPIVALAAWLAIIFKGVDPPNYLALVFAGFSAWFSKEHFDGFMNMVDDLYRAI